MREEFGWIVGFVPRNVQRHRRRRTGQLLDDGDVFHLLEHIGRFSKTGKSTESCSSRTERPRRNGACEAAHRLHDAIHVYPTSRKLFAELGKRGLVDLWAFVILLVQEFGVQHRVKVWFLDFFDRKETQNLWFAGSMATNCLNSSD